MRKASFAKFEPTSSTTCHRMCTASIPSNSVRILCACVIYNMPLSIRSLYNDRIYRHLQTIRITQSTGNRPIYVYMPALACLPGFPQAWRRSVSLGRIAGASVARLGHTHRHALSATVCERLYRLCQIMRRSHFFQPPPFPPGSRAYRAV